MLAVFFKKIEKILLKNSFSKYQFNKIKKTSNKKQNNNLIRQIKNACNNLFTAKHIYFYNKHFWSYCINLIIYIVLCWGTNSFASLNDELEQAFNEIQNISNPNYYQTERRGVISGGHISTRANIKHLNPIAISSPKLKAGCGGIDLYGGSFSYINKEEFITFLRTIAANAKGYAFQIALSSMCEKCSQHIEALQRKVMELNTYFGNSCQLAQGIVNDSLSAFDKKGLSDASLIGEFKGLGDAFELNTVSDSTSLYKKIADANLDTPTELYGNIMWQSLMSNSDLRQDVELAEAIMSLTGSFITTTDSDKDLISLPNNLISLEDFIEGGDLELYKCDATAADACLNVTSKKSQILGLAINIEQIFLGLDLMGNSGILAKLTTSNESFSTKELNLINSMPSGVFAMIRTLSAKNKGAATAFIETSARVLAIDVAKKKIFNYLSIAQSNVLASRHPYAKLMVNNLSNVQNTIEREAVNLHLKYGTIKDLTQTYELMLRAISVKNYLDI